MVLEEPLEGRGVVPGDVVEAGRAELRLHVAGALPGERGGAERLPVVAPFGPDDDRAARREARQANRDLDGLGAALGEGDDPVSRADRREARQALGEGERVHRARRLDHRRRPLAPHGEERLPDRVRVVAERERSVLRREVEDAPSAVVLEPGALPPHVGAVEAEVLEELEELGVQVNVHAATSS